ncbi:Splicing factor U2af large subunit A [Striga hermonthica]|uniref:Splicing factor U2af large subunit A n=1 Tax=Striga hermonthica TaxID=68872 RepID=A0A9N7ML95_STRHE|nr:Splicing factor U2af large subunit A [Striga hermonthica]
MADLSADIEDIRLGIQTMMHGDQTNRESRAGGRGEDDDSDAAVEEYNPLAFTAGRATRHARRVYVGGLSATANEQSVATFFSHVMSAIGGNTAGPGDAVVNVYINHDKKFAYVEMRSVEEASNAMALDGIMFEGAPVKVRRPSDYNPSLAATLGPSLPNPNLNLAAVGLTPGSSGGLEGPDRIFVGGLMYYFTEELVRELLETFGPLRGIDLVKDRETGNSKGYAFCVYEDPSVTDIACAALNGMKMGNKTLTVRRANQGVQPNPEQESVLLHAQQQVALQVNGDFDVVLYVISFMFGAATKPLRLGFSSLKEITVASTQAEVQHPGC